MIVQGRAFIKNHWLKYIPELDYVLKGIYYLIKLYVFAKAGPRFNVYSAEVDTLYIDFVIDGLRDWLIDWWYFSTYIDTGMLSLVH